MVEKIFEALVSGLVVPIILELWKDRRRRNQDRYAHVVPAGEAIAAAPARPAQKRHYVRATARLLVAALPGFFFAGITAGFLEAGGGAKIEFGGAVANFLIVAWIIGTWLLLAHFGPLKSHT